MALITWTNEYNIGIADIDAQHRVLCDLINKLDDSSKSGKGTIALEAVYSELTNYTVFHFNHEEALMRKAGYPDFDNHIKIHRSIVNRVNELNAQYKAGSTTAIHDAITFLTNWLIDHIQGIDRKYVPYMHDQGIK